MDTGLSKKGPAHLKSIGPPFLIPAPRCLKKPPRGLKTPKKPPRRLQEALKIVQEGSETHKDRSTTPKMVPRQSNMPPRRPKKPPRAFPRGTQEPKWLVLLGFLNDFLVLGFSVSLRSKTAPEAS